MRNTRRLEDKPFTSKFARLDITSAMEDVSKTVVKRTIFALENTSKGALFPSVFYL